jgi:histidinol-phosphatase (PHP family)
VRVDYHTHNARCGHAIGQMSEYIEAAIGRGINEIGLSDHSPILHLGDHDQPLPQTAMAMSQLPGYMAEIAELRDRYANQITVRLGIESDFIEGLEERYRALWKRYPLDYVIGSVHFLDGWSIFQPVLPTGRTAEDVYTEYLKATQLLAKSGVYDIVAHLDCLKTSGHIPDLTITPLLEETVKVIAQSGMAVELNTSGWRKHCADCYPRQELLALLCHYAVPITLSSDAHKPEQVAHGFDDAVALLQEVGYHEIATYQQRRRVMCPLG